MNKLIRIRSDFTYPRMKNNPKKEAAKMTSDDTDPLESMLVEVATRYQQNYYEISSDWNRYEKNEHDYLKDYIGYGLYGPPESTSANDDKSPHFVYDEKQRESINLVFEKVLEYGNCKESDGVVLCSIIYNVIFNKEQILQAQKEKLAKLDNPAVAEGGKDNNHTAATEGDVTSEDIDNDLQVFPVPVFKVRQYLKANSEKTGTAKENIEKTYYIDNSARVYDGFKDYLESNKLPKCTMVLPKDGRYQIDPACFKNIALDNENFDGVVSTVWLEIHQSPACRIVGDVLIGADIASTVVTVASMGVGIASMFTPIGAGVALASAIGAGVSGVWTTGRSVQQLADRGLHGESINVTDRSALGAWIGIAGSTMGLAATGSTVLLTRAVRAGTTIGRAATVAYDAVLIGNLIVNGVGMSFKGYDMYISYKENGDISARDVLFMTAHIFFFCNSVINIRFATSIIETSQGQLLKDYEASLRSNRHRKEFQRMARNTRAAGSNDLSSNEEIIRGINRIDNKDEFFQAMVRNRKVFSASGAKVAFSDGKVTVNSIMTIDPIEFASLPKDTRFDIVKSVSSASGAARPDNKPSNTSTLNTVGTSGLKANNSGGTKSVQPNEASYKKFVANNDTILKEFCIKHSSAIIQSAHPQVGHFMDVLNELRAVQNYGAIFLKLLELGYLILQSLPRDQDLVVGDILASVVQFLWDYIKSSLRRLRPGAIIDDPNLAPILSRLMTELWTSVERKIEIWVDAFKVWLKNNIPQTIRIPLQGLAAG